jgi:GNAT superfamily N-acetyltransferase
VIIREVNWDDPDGMALRHAQRDELEIRYETPDSEPGPAPTGDDITVFLVAVDDDGSAVACGGLRRIDNSHGEVKRMFVRPERRGSGVSTLVLRELERRARDELGWESLVLETGNRQPDAIRFYEREGYTRIPNFGYYAASDYSLCYERVLAEKPS